MTPLILAAAIASCTSLNLDYCVEVDRSSRMVSLYKDNEIIKSFPVAVGKPSTPTPAGVFTVLDKQLAPDWIHIYTGELIPAGSPRNPIPYWVEFADSEVGDWKVGFHVYPVDIGEASSNGCARMDAINGPKFYDWVQLGDTVVVK